MQKQNRHSASREEKRTRGALAFRVSAGAVYMRLGNHEGEDHRHRQAQTQQDHRPPVPLGTGGATRSRSANHVQPDH